MAHTNLLLTARKCVAVIETLHDTYIESMY